MFRDVIKQILHGNFASHIIAIYVNFLSCRSQIRFAIRYQFIWLAFAIAHAIQHLRIARPRSLRSPVPALLDELLISLQD